MSNFQVRETITQKTKRFGAVHNVDKINHAVALLKSFPSGGAIIHVDSEMFLMTRTVVEGCGEFTNIYEFFTAPPTASTFSDRGNWLTVNEKEYKTGT